MESMQYIPRLQEKKIKEIVARDKSVLLLGPRQTGKSTLVENLNPDLLISLLIPEIRQRYEKNPGILIKELEVVKSKNKKNTPLIFIDEIQKVSKLFDVIQYIIDKKIARFILTGSSARKLRRGSNINLLPGRLITVKLDPFVISELPSKDLTDLLLYGSLPGIYFTDGYKNKDDELKSYVTAYLEEEVRSEAIVRNVGSFARFLELAASESGNIINLRKLSQEIGVSHTTIGSYYEILEDCLIIERIEPITKSSTRKKLTKSHKYLFFDLGVRRLAAQEGTKLPKELLGKIFEQFIGIELIRCSRIANNNTKIKFWRDPDGPEVNWVIEREGEYFPIEVKWTSTPSDRDIKHLKIFLAEYKNSKEGYLICQTPNKIKLDKKITAIPWQEVNDLIFT